MMQINNRSDYMDVDSALDRMRGNGALLKKMLILLPGSLPLEDLLAQQQSGDREALVKTVHTIKGVAANLSLTAAHTQAVEIEEMLGRGELPEERLQQLAQTLRMTLQHAEQVANML